ncbi:MAG: tRNA pseudouridine(55) synthase TruB [Nitrospirota bacterium]
MDGFLIINKPPDWTSHDVVAKVRGLLRETRVGHTGTLDPLATGVLPICIGRATKVAHYLLETDKEYRVVMRLGATTDTQDATGRVLTRSTVRVAPDEVIRVLQGFVGSQTQIPPMYSAVKVGGVPLYKAARAGRVVERRPRAVTISRLQVLGIAEDDVTFDVTCSKGTYVRTLCADAGERLGVGAYMQALDRRRVGAFGIDQAVTLGELEAAARDGTVGQRVVSIDLALSDTPAAEVDPETAERVCHGVALPAARVARWLGACRAGGLVRIRSNGVTVALATAPADHATLLARGTSAVLKIDRVLRDRVSKVSSDQGFSQDSVRSR